MQMKQTRHLNDRSKPKNASLASSKRTRSGKELLAKMKQNISSEKKVNEDLPKPQVRIVEVTAKNDGQRLDNFLMSELKGVPKSHISRLVRSGQVRINKGRCQVEDRLSVGDLVRIPPVRVSESTEKREAPAFSLDKIPTVLFEDRDILAVNKPAGLASHGGSGVSYGLIEQLRATRKDLDFLELVHRLDRGTSGVMILAKTRKALVRLHEAIREGQIHKTYRTLVKGQWLNERQHVKLPLYKYVSTDGQRYVRVDHEKGQKAHTIFKLIERFKLVSYLEVELLTGRTHQIRVHAASENHPLVGDEKYGDFKFNEEVEKGLLAGIHFKRMFLHAYKIELRHPISGIELKIEAPLPADCQQLIDALERENG